MYFMLILLFQTYPKTKTKYMLKKSIILWLITSYSIISFGQSNEYAKIKLTLNSPNDITLLNELNIDIDHYQTSGENAIEFVVNLEDLTSLDAAHFSYELLIPNYRAYYQERSIKEQANLDKVVRPETIADHFGYGSMGGFYTLSEMEEKLDEMNADFPHLATPKYSIGTSIEGRSIWAVKISDNPMLDEEEESVYYDALHHAREPLSMAVSINYAFWLLENYETNEQVKYMLDNREVYIVPCVNPDGYEYNRETDPEGGGLWRKNRRAVSDICVGIDLNRNYSFGYAYDSNCASTQACSQTYRGREAFSEPESVAVRDFLAEIKPNTAFSIHSTAGSCLMPYGYNTSPPAYPIYSEWASDFLSQNNYPYGVTAQMLGYTSCGTTRSYLHSEGIYGWTLEIDGSGFWPPESTIFELVGENVYPLFYQTWIAGQYTDVQSHELIGSAVPGESFQMNVEVKNKGLGSTPSNVEVLIQSNDVNVLISGDGFIGKVASREKAMSQNFNIYLDPLFEGEELELTMMVNQDGTEMNKETIIIPVGVQTVLFEDDAENGVANWISSGVGIDWGLSSDDAYNGSYSFGDSDNGNSQNNTDNYFTISEAIDLSTTDKPYLEFYTKWSLASGDLAALQIFTNEDTNWTTLKTFTDSESWHQELFDLSAYKKEEVSIRFMLQTDFNIPGDGFYFDKISVSDYSSVDMATGISEMNQPAIHFYPNPTSNYLTLELMDATPTEIKIFDTKGTIIREITTTNSCILDLNDISPNLYIVKIKNLVDGTILTRKMIKL